MDEWLELAEQSAHAEYGIDYDNEYDQCVLCEDDYHVVETTDHADYGVVCHGCAENRGWM